MHSVWAQKALYSLSTVSQEAFVKLFDPSMTCCPVSKLSSLHSREMENTSEAGGICKTVWPMHPSCKPQSVSVIKTQSLHSLPDSRQG